ncbi:hypothetical protein JTE90_007303 [Oedothorax gibbosus]|uniref:Uncharacterized protein n=1 Tax=Oedothorax gibbosus TaxID=931172 RepID=A0AAV6UH06_9ARAC|nr:hypothetical protein JTE90_007303 [Oedothorax gibbosus]
MSDVMGHGKGCATYVNCPKKQMARTPITDADEHLAESNMQEPRLSDTLSVLSGRGRSNLMYELAEGTGRNWEVDVFLYVHILKLLKLIMPDVW